MFQLGVPTCQEACKFFEYSSYEMITEISILFYHVKNSAFILDIKLYLIYLLYVSHVYVSYIKIVLYFISILHVISWR